MEKTLHEIAKLIDGQILGDGSTKVSGLANITAAHDGDLIFAVPPHLDEAKISAATAVLIPLDIEDFPKPAIKVVDPRAAFAKLIEMFMPKLNIPVEISPKAHIGKNVKISDGVTIMPFAVIDDGAEIQRGAVIYPHVYIGQHAIIGEDSIIYSSVTIREFCKVGKRFRLYN